MVQNPGMETHIHPFEVYSKISAQSKGMFLHTSPEFELKQVLTQVEEFQNIYSISYCFRDEPNSPQHRHQFLMLEWYRKNHRYEKIMEDLKNLVSHCYESLGCKVPEKFEYKTVSELFNEYAEFEILDFLDAKRLREKILKDLPTVPIPDQECSFDDYFFLVFLNLIEPKLVEYPFLIIDKYPAPLAALSTISEDDPRVCERFELYINGIEIANCFNELTDFSIQEQRFIEQKEEKKYLYKYELPYPEQFMNALAKGYPKSAGIALGVERLMGAITKIENPFYR